MSHKRPYAFTAQNRIKDRSDFIALRIRGRRLRTPHFYIHVLDKNEGLRLGVTVSRKIGNAVVRNRVKRLIREFFRHHYDQMHSAADFSVVARPGAGLLNLAQVSKELRVILGSPPDRIADD